jgi:hypothetical protein
MLYVARRSAPGEVGPSRRNMLRATYGKPRFGFHTLGEYMHHVYLLRSLAAPEQTYIGLTDDMPARLKSAGRLPPASHAQPPA